MKTPGQRQLITLQEQVKLGIVNVDEAVLHFKEWQLNQKKRSESFRFQQENLKRLRESITRRQREKQNQESRQTWRSRSQFGTHSTCPGKWRLESMRVAPGKASSPQDRA